MFKDPEWLLESLDVSRYQNSNPLRWLGSVRNETEKLFES